MILDSTLLNLQAVLVGAVSANQPECHVDYIQWNSEGVPTKPRTFRTALNSTTDVNILAAPATATFILEPIAVSIYNKDTASVTVIVKTDDATTERIIVKATLLTLETLCYEKGRGWYALDANGNIKETVSSVSASAILGTTTNDSAGAGRIGEFVSSLVASGSPVSLTNNTAANVTNISLTAGDWDVEGNVNFSGTTATVTAGTGGISATSATLPTDGSEVYDGTVTTLLSDLSSVTLPMKRISIAATTTIYLVAKKLFSAGTVVAFGSMNARRVR